MSRRFTLPQAALALVIALFLLVFLVVPVFTVIFVDFTNSDGSLTFAHFRSFFQLTLMREAFYNSLYVGGMSVVVSSIFALPLAYFTARFQFRGALAIQTLGVLPLIMPPFVGATAMQLLFGRSGSLNLILGDWFDLNLPLMEGLNAVVFVEALHYFPFILLNLTAALNNIDSAMEEAAENFGASNRRTIFRIVVPLMAGGILAGFVTSFLTVAVEISATLMLVSATSDAPASYGIYLYMQSIVGRGPGAALGVIMVLLVGLGTYASHRIMRARSLRFETLQALK